MSAGSAESRRTALTEQKRCAECGRPFRRRGNVGKFCGPTCYHASQKGIDRTPPRTSVTPVRPLVMRGDVAEVPLSRGFVALIDAADAPLVAPFGWRAVTSEGHTYALRTLGNGAVLYLHRFLMQPPPGFVVDHVDGNGLNNRRSNLRLATVAQNGMNSRRPVNNTTGFKGVTYAKARNQFFASIMADNHVYRLGYFKTAEEAHAAYRGAAKVLHGKFARFK